MADLAGEEGVHNPLVALVAGGLSEEDAKMVITMIAKKQVPNIAIAY